MKKNTNLKDLATEIIKLSELQKGADSPGRTAKSPYLRGFFILPAKKTAKIRIKKMTEKATIRPKKRTPSQDWYFEYTYRGERQRKTFGINRLSGADKIVGAKLIKTAINELLAAGIDPSQNPDQIENAKDSDLVSNLNNALEVKTATLSRHAYNSYKNKISKLIEWVKIKELKKLTNADLVYYAAWLQDQGKKNSTINQYLKAVRNVWNQAIKLGIIEAKELDVKKLRTIESDKYEKLTVKECERIFTYFHKHNKEMYLYISCLYYLFSRTAETAKIEIKNIDLDRQILTLGSSTTKNANQSKKYIFDHLLPFFEDQMDGKEKYLFPSDRKKDSPKSDATFRLLWNDVVKDKLGINKQMYALKHTGGAHLAELNHGQENMQFIQAQMNHSDLQTTSIYLGRAKNLSHQGKKIKIRKF